MQRLSPTSSNYRIDGFHMAKPKRCFGKQAFRCFGQPFAGGATTKPPTRWRRRMTRSRSSDGKRAEAEIREVATELFAGWCFPQTIDLSTSERVVTQ